MSAELEAKLRAWVESELGVPVTELALIPGGASRRSYKVNRADAAPVLSPMTKRRVFTAPAAAGLG